MSDLKPCPFCGGKTVGHHHIRDGRAVACKDCSGSIRAFHPDAQEKAFEKWNTRAQDSSTGAPAGNTPARLSNGTIDNILSKLDQGAAHQGYAEGFGFSWTQLAGDAATIIRRLRRPAAPPARSAASTVEPVSLRQMAQRIEEALNAEFSVTEGYGPASWTVAHHLYAAPTTSPEPIDMLAWATRDLDGYMAHANAMLDKAGVPARFRRIDKTEMALAMKARETSPEPTGCPSCGQSFPCKCVSYASPEPDAVREIDFNKLANDMTDPVVRELAVMVMSEQTGSRWMMSAAEAAIKEIIRLRAALSRPAHGGWEDISTAPKDREILAVRIEWWEPENGNHRWIHGNIRQTKWDAERQRFGFDHEKQPTHWTEVPAIPALPLPRDDRQNGEPR